MKIATRKVSTVVAFLMLAGSAAVSQQFFLFGKRPKADDVFFLTDHAAFRSHEPGKIRLEIYYQIYNAILNFHEQDGMFVAEYEISVKILGKKHELIDSYRRQKRVKVGSENKAKSGFDYRTNQVKFELKPGKYEVVIALRDPNSNMVINRRWKIKLKEYEDKHPKLSGIELVQEASVRGAEPSRFDKGSMTLIPSVSSRYGEENRRHLRFYVEIYQGHDSTDAVRVETMLRSHAKGMVYRDSLTTTFADYTVRELREISLGDLLPGDYELIVALKGKRNKKYDQAKKNFRVAWSEKAFIKHDFKTVVSQLSIIGPKDQMEKLKGHETYEVRLAAFNEFWLAWDPTPGTSENEYKREFYRRVQIADESFSLLGHSGWRTDRGRVYILFGEPDQVDDYPVVSDRRPYQEWHYYRGSRYRKFVFVDVNEDGDYRLRYPYDGLNQRPEF